MAFDYRERLRLADLEKDLAKEVKDLNKLARSASRTGTILMTSPCGKSFPG